MPENVGSNEWLQKHSKHNRELSNNENKGTSHRATNRAHTLVRFCRFARSLLDSLCVTPFLALSRANRCRTREARIAMVAWSLCTTYLNELASRSSLPQSTCLLPYDVHVACASNTVAR